MIRTNQRLGSRQVAQFADQNFHSLKGSLNFWTEGSLFFVSLAYKQTGNILTIHMVGTVAADQSKILILLVKIVTYPRVVTIMVPLFIFVK